MCIGFKILYGSFKRIYARLSFALKFTDVGSGVVDATYRGPVCVVFFNFSINIIEIEKGLRFEQIVFKKCPYQSLREVESFDGRSIFCGQNGFDLTGLKYLFLFFKY